jgi:CheY-like chemotaxis protein
MQLRSNCPRSVRGAETSVREPPLQAAVTSNLATTAADAVEFSSGKTRYRGPCRVSADPVRVLIVSTLAECIGIAALIHSIGQFSTRMACSGEMALKLGGEFLPDIVLLTTALPDLASYRVAAALRWGSGRPFPRLIAITDDIPPGDRHRALAAGFEQYLIVPVQRAALECVLRHRRTAPLPYGHRRTPRWQLSPHELTPVALRFSGPR